MQEDNMFESKGKGVAAFALAASFVMVLCALAAVPLSDATGDDLAGYGAVNEISIAPGYSWSYTSTFPADLEAGTVLTFEKNELEGVATIDNHTLKISAIPADKAGGKYNIVLKAYHAESDQTAYQWIRITVNNAMSVSYTGCINEIVKGTSQTIDLKSEGGIGTVTWTATTMAPRLTLSGNKITGTPTQVGANTIVLKATSDKGESKDLTINFTVFNVIKGDSEETVAAIGGKPVSTRAITQTGDDLGVTWKADTNLPVGLTLNTSTGVISGAYEGTAAGEKVVTLTGTSTHGPSQTTTKKVTINFEPAFTLGDVAKVLTYKGNADVTSAAMAPSTDEHSLIDYTIKTSVTGVSINVTTGVLTFKGTTSVTDAGTVTVVATTALGQVVEKDVQYLVEDTLSITGPAKLVAKQGIAASQAYTLTGGSSNNVAVGDNTYNGGLTFADGKLKITFPDAHASEKVKLTVTSAAGQTATIDVDVVVYSTMGFNSSPGATGIFAYAA